jgi:hypothetical protein
MRNMEQTNSGILELTDAELDAVNGGNWIGDIGRAIVKAVEYVASGFQGPGDLRSPTKQP